MKSMKKHVEDRLEQRREDLAAAEKTGNRMQIRMMKAKVQELEDTLDSHGKEEE